MPKAINATDANELIVKAVCRALMPTDWGFEDWIGHPKVLSCAVEERPVEEGEREYPLCVRCQVKLVSLNINPFFHVKVPRDCVGCNAPTSIMVDVVKLHEELGFKRASALVAEMEELRS